MGTYKRNAEYSPTNGGNVYTKTDDSDMHLHRGNGGFWDVSKTANMIEGKDAGFIASTSSSHSPLDLEWEFWDNTAISWQVDPLLKVTGS
jgi:hypothetical protein